MPVRLRGLDWAVVGAGALLLIAGFLPWWRVGVTASDVTLVPARDATAWDVSPAWWLPVLAGVVTAGLWLLHRSGQISLRWVPAVTALVGLVGLGLVLGRWATLPAGTGAGSGDFGWFSYGPLPDTGPVADGTAGIGLWLAAAALAVQVVAAALTLRRRERVSP